MRVLRIPRRGLTIFGLWSLSLTLGVAGCSGGGGSQSTPAGPSIAATVNPAAICVAGAGGVAYLPDGGSSPAGIMVQPFEKRDGSFLASCTASFLTASASITDLAISAAGTGVAVTDSGLTLLGLGGVASNQVPYFSLLHLTNTTPITSVAILPVGTFALAVDNEAPAPGPTAGFIGVNNLLGLSPTPVPSALAVAPSPAASGQPSPAPTAYNPPIINPAQVSYASIGTSPTASPSTGLAIPPGSIVGRPSLALGPDGVTILVRGDKDLIAFQSTPSAAGNFISYPAAGTTSPVTTAGLGQSLALGYPTGSTAAVYAHGLMAFSPATASRALLGGDKNGSRSAVTLLTGIPSSFQAAASLDLQSTVTSVAVTNNGNIAAVGTVNGLVILNGVAGGTLATVSQPNFSSGISFAPATTSATVLALKNVFSVGFSSDGKFLIVLADNGNRSASLIAFAVDGNGILRAPLTGTGLPATIGTSIPAPSGDYMVVR